MSTTGPGAAPGPRGAVWVWAQSVLMLALLALGPMYPGAWHHPAGLVLGWILFATAAVVGILGVVQLGDNRTPFPRPRPGSRLVQRGLYGWIRHPLYTSVLLAGFGWSLLFQSAPALVLAVLLVPFFAAKARAEERWLSAAFPGYAAYARRVKRFVPGVW